jgi:tRNA(Arg) A34 adenosine deaminase TadA
MDVAIKEAKVSLQEGNRGFGAVIVRDNRVISSAHDEERTQRDPTAHAAVLAIRRAIAEIGPDLDGCGLICTYEPCPMCAGAVLASGIATVAFGISIEETLPQGGQQGNFSCREFFSRSGRPVEIVEGVLREECSLLYDQRVRSCIADLRDLDDRTASLLAERLSDKRLAWYETQDAETMWPGDSLLERAYRLFLAKLSITSHDAPVVRRSATRLVIHSRNFCPVLEACRILDLDTRRVCALVTEEPMDKLLKRLDPRLGFSRDYKVLRPHAPYCEEFITLAR